MLMLLYSLGLALALLLSTPWWLLRMLVTPRYREGLRERLGEVPAPIRQAARNRRVIWIHAVSVGEVLAASTLIAELERTLGPAWQVVLSTTTRTGQQLARKRFGSTRVFYFPFDFRFAVRPWLGALRPELLILVESELWPRLLHECAAAAIPVAVVNARISDRSLRRTLRVPSLWTLMARHVTVWLAQSAEDAARLLRLGVDPARVQNTGNLKYDTRTPERSEPAGAVVTAIRASAAGRPVVIAGSTVHYGTTPEEAIVLDAVRDHIWPDMPDVLLILAPRHPERFAEVAVLAAGFGTTLRATSLLAVPPGEPAPAPPFARHMARLTERILVLDTIGDLAFLYRLANVAFIGGSLLPHGGHNPLEPAQFGVPVVMGPHVENFRDIVARFRAADAMVLLEDTAPAPLGRALAALLADPTQARALGQRGHAVCESQKGASARMTAALLPLLRPGLGNTRSSPDQPDAPGPDFRPRNSAEAQNLAGAPFTAESHPAVSGLAIHPPASTGPEAAHP